MNSFRDFEKSLCILWDRACINILDPDQVSGANGIVELGFSKKELMVLKFAESDIDRAMQEGKENV